MAADLSGYNVPKERPVPQQSHIDSAKAREDYDLAVRVIMYGRNLPYPEAVKVVEKEKVATILAKHNAVVAPAKKV
jgi:hypothetical protein